MKYLGGKFLDTQEHTTHSVESDLRTPIFGDKVPVKPIADKDLRKLNAT